MKENPLRLLDCKNEKCFEAKQNAPQILDFLCDTCKRHFKETLEFLDTLEIPYFLDNHLVRGIDYYSKTVFEIFSETKKGNENDEDNNEETQSFALGGGGRYDYLAKMIGKKDIQAVGGSIGVNRVIQLLKDKKIKIKPKKAPKIFFIQLGQSAKYKSLSIIEMLRKARVPLSQSISKDSLGGQLNLASKLNIPYALILGQKEIIDNTIIIKDMQSMEQETVPISKVVETIKKKLK